MGVSSSVCPGGTRCFGRCLPVGTAATVCSRLRCRMDVHTDTGKAASVSARTLKCCKQPRANFSSFQATFTDLSPFLRTRSLGQLVWGQAGPLPMHFHPLSQYWEFKMLPKDRGHRNKKQDASCVHLNTWHAFLFFLLRKHLSFFTALHLPAQKWVEEQTPPDFISSTSASGRPSENRSETSSMCEEW